MLGLLAIGLLAIGLESLALIDGHRQGLLLHLHLRASSASIQASIAPHQNLFGAALIRFSTSVCV